MKCLTVLFILLILLIISLIILFILKCRKKLRENLKMKSSGEKISVCFSGGGHRAFSCAYGEMRVLLDLDKDLKNIDTFSTVSGGSWFISQFLFNSYFTELDEKTLDTWFSQAISSYKDNVEVDLTGKYLPNIPTFKEYFELLSKMRNANWYSFIQDMLNHTFPESNFNWGQENPKRKQYKDKTILMNATIFPNGYWNSDNSYNIPKFNDTPRPVYFKLGVEPSPTITIEGGPKYITLKKSGDKFEFPTTSSSILRAISASSAALAVLSSDNLLGYINKNPTSSYFRNLSVCIPSKDQCLMPTPSSTSVPLRFGDGGYIDDSGILSAIVEKQDSGKTIKILSFINNTKSEKNNNFKALFGEPNVPIHKNVNTLPIQIFKGPAPALQPLEKSKELDILYFRDRRLTTLKNQYFNIKEGLTIDLLLFQVNSNLGDMAFESTQKNFISIEENIHNSLLKNKNIIKNWIGGN